MNIDSEIAELLTLIREKREEKGLSQKQIAEALGMAQQTYQQIESGKTDLKLRTLYVIAEYLGIDITVSKSKGSNLIALNPDDVINKINKIDNIEAKQDDINQKLDEILDLFKKKKK